MRTTPISKHTQIVAGRGDEIREHPLTEPHTSTGGPTAPSILPHQPAPTVPQVRAQHGLTQVREGRVPMRLVPQRGANQKTGHQDVAVREVRPRPL